MQINWLGHSCLLVETDDARLLIDPGIFSQGFDGLTGLTGVLVTHQHPDHLDQGRLPEILRRNPGVPLYTDPQTAAILEAGGITASAVHAGDTIEDVGVAVTVHGRHHAVVHRDIPVVDNVGYLIGGRLLHPGDSLHVPDERVEILALPAAAPWMALKEAIDFLRAVNPAHAIPIHTAVLSETGLGLHRRLLETLGPESTTLHLPAVGSHLEV